MPVVSQCLRCLYSGYELLLWVCFYKYGFHLPIFLSIQLSLNGDLYISMNRTKNKWFSSTDFNLGKSLMALRFLFIS